jgi:hypothetical protein
LVECRLCREDSLQVASQARPAATEQPAHPVKAERMCAPVWFVVISGLIPLTKGLLANRSTSLLNVVIWAIAAWAGWIVSVAGGSPPENYLALALTACAGVSVLGARWPGAAAWNFVVGGLLIVLLLPLTESLALGGGVRPGTVRAVFLGSLIGVTVINYLPTRLGVAAILVAIGCGWNLAGVLSDRSGSGLGGWCIGLAPWAGWIAMRTKADAPSAADRLWRNFRDHYGLIWALRVREQFNRAATNAGLACELRWQGFRGDGGETACELLRDLLKRFLS